MKFLLLLCLLLSTSVFAAETKMKLNAKNIELSELIENYSKASGQRFIIDSTVRGKISILNPAEVSIEEAFNQISEALALNGFAIVKNGDVMTIRNARSAQRDNIETYDTLPSAKPQRMVTWIITLKHTSASDLMMQLRMLSSSYGELSAVRGTNQLVITDWTSNIQHVSEMIKRVDVPADPALAKIIAKSKKETRPEKHTQDSKDKKTQQESVDN